MFKYFKNIGYLESKLSVNHMSLLKKYIKNRSKKHKTDLAGNLNGSFQLKDTDNKFFKEVKLIKNRKKLRRKQVIILNKEQYIT